MNGAGDHQHGPPQAIVGFAATNSDADALKSTNLAPQDARNESSSDSSDPSRTSSTLLRYLAGLDPIMYPKEDSDNNISRLDNVSSPRSKSPSDMFSPPQTVYLNNHSVAGDEPRYALPTRTRRECSATHDSNRDTTVVLRHQFALDPRQAGDASHLRLSRPWGSGVDYPPPCLRNYALTDDMLFRPEPERGSGVDVEGMLEGYDFASKKLEECLGERAKVTKQLQMELIIKKTDLRGLQEDLQYQTMFPEGVIRQEFLVDTYADIVKVEGEISELKERLHERRLDSEDLVLRAFGCQPKKRKVDDPPAFSRLVKPVSERGTTPGLVVQKHKIQGNPNTEYEILVPDWFPVFASYRIIRLPDHKSMVERYRELLNIIYRLEDAIETNKAKEKIGMKTFDKQWHEPSPYWEHAFQRKHGG